MDDKLAAAIVAALVSILGSVLTLLAAHWQVRSKLSELEQGHLKEVLDGRMKAYPELWRILQARVSNWRMEGKRATGDWAATLYADLNACHANYGVFFSEPVYEAFREVRETTRKLATTYGPHEDVPAEAVRELDEIWSGREKPGLATELKDDLGSYRPTIISARARAALF